MLYLLPFVVVPALVHATGLPVPPIPRPVTVQRIIGQPCGYEETVGDGSLYGRTTKYTCAPDLYCIPTNHWDHSTRWSRYKGVCQYHANKGQFCSPRFAPCDKSKGLTCQLIDFQDGSFGHWGMCIDAGTAH